MDLCLCVKMDVGECLDELSDIFLLVVFFFFFLHGFISVSVPN